MTLFERDSAGCLPGCNWPRERCLCLPQSHLEHYTEKAIVVGMAVVVGVTLVFIIHVFWLGLKAL